MPTPAAAATVARGFLSGLRDVVLGVACAGCAAPGELLCGRCAAVLMSPARRTAPTPCPEGLPQVWSVTAYDGAVRAALCAYKEHGQLGLVRPLGRALATAVLASMAAADAEGIARQAPPPTERFVLVGVPSSPAAVRKRGHDATARLAQVAAACLRKHGVDVEAMPVLRLRRRVADQVGLSAPEREANVAGAFEVCRGRSQLIASRSVMIIDDVITSGATLVEAARAIAAAGADEPRAAVIAATRRRGSSTLAGQDR